MADNNHDCLSRLNSFTREGIHEWYDEINREAQSGLAQHYNMFVVNDPFGEPGIEVMTQSPDLSH